MVSTSKNVHNDHVQCIKYDFQNRTSKNLEQFFGDHVFQERAMQNYLKATKINLIPLEQKGSGGQKRAICLFFQFFIFLLRNSGAKLQESSNSLYS